MLLKNKKILVAVTGSIAIYKSLELIRLYIKAGAVVKVLMTESAKKFINPITFEAISQNKVLDEDNESWDKQSTYNHIDIGKWADIFVIAPASANTINKISNGIADNLLTQTVLAYPKLKILSPAANTNMITNPITLKSIENLKLSNFKIVHTQVKELACKDVGDGAMAEPQEIFNVTARELLKEQYWENRSVVLSGGGTIEKIDDVRYISNFSSGKMAASLAKALYFKGANVTLVSTRGYENLPSSINLIPVQSSEDMYESLVDSLSIEKKQNLNKKTYLFMVAAVSDYLPNIKEEGKLKKELIGTSWSLKLKQNIDILNTLEKSEIISIGFKAELDQTVANENAQKMLINKKINGVCLNIIDENNNFGSDNNKIELVLKDKSFSFSAPKFELSMELLNCLKKEFNGY
ncbi:bifunctional phosphopantothenoylcysteine decarboxylase/phosphopantothenate--cysteine ligase CoaBC [Arcobacter sp. CECT 8985]|uniref:bifunctional phosphopantothenoylcysteine decarboxylase/phosphopantothenate--cysteine ligase CoaBC n=1 Tax=Arcobacter sp. CECT 8985 TaxID=1935424 RepID=UPI00100B03C4|nr:bifunctional phosphopantothenoylcysteine decarboxylase/phosphopantothenate--cysteine ligase CoaBC [Arcobacter sp. CECT 8985]RXJ85586.1 bifunctional phosphopantothenoylcysteine decarboxylase/phosphopantothenate--cysteine ligase CoaBC [Arcobacter sp. CECT 8985]